MRFIVSRTYEIVTEESAEHGDAAEHGFVFENTEMSLRDAVRELEDCFELSCSPVRQETCQDVWASTESAQDWRTGEYRSESVHIKASGRNLYRLFRLAGLVK